MSSPLELKKMKVELLRVSAAKAELEYRIEESMENIKRIEDSIKIQKDKEEELSAKIQAMETELASK